MTLARRGYRRYCQLAGVISACVAVWWAFRDVSLPRVVALLSGIGPFGALLVLVPQLLSLASETHGFRMAFALEKVRFLALFRVRLATECAICLPAGVVLSESLKVPLLVKSCGFSVPGAIAAIVARKYLLLTSQSIYILTGATFGFSALALASQKVLGSPGLAQLLLAFGGIVGAAGLGLRALLSRGHCARALRQRLFALPNARLRSSLERHAAAFAETDGSLERFFSRGARREAVVTCFFLGGWMFESVETFLLLRLLGVDLDFFEVASFEVALSLLRNLVFVVPAGLGFQDAGYVLFLRALGVPNAVDAGAAFALLKRSKELLWATIGFALLTSELGSTSSTKAARRAQTAPLPLPLP